MITIRKASKSYNKGAVRAVDDLGLVIEPGEIFGILGPNGAGWTTTIKLLVGILRPDSGTILINGIDNQARLLTWKSMTTYVPDNPAVYERLTGIGAVVLIPMLLALVPFSGSRGLNASPLVIPASHNPACVIPGAASFLTVCGCLNGTAAYRPRGCLPCGWAQTALAPAPGLD